MKTDTVGWKWVLVGWVIAFLKELFEAICESFVEAQKWVSTFGRLVALFFLLAALMGVPAAFRWLHVESVAGGPRWLVPALDKTCLWMMLQCSVVGTAWYLVHKPQKQKGSSRGDPSRTFHEHVRRMQIICAVAFVPWVLVHDVGSRLSMQPQAELRFMEAFGVLALDLMILMFGASVLYSMALFALWVGRGLREMVRGVSALIEALSFLIFYAACSVIDAVVVAIRSAREYRGDGTYPIVPAAALFLLGDDVGAELVDGFVFEIEPMQRFDLARANRRFFWEVTTHLPMLLINRLQGAIRSVLHWSP